MSAPRPLQGPPRRRPTSRQRKGAVDDAREARLPQSEAEQSVESRPQRSVSEAGSSTDAVCSQRSARETIAFPTVEGPRWFVQHDFVVRDERIPRQNPTRENRRRATSGEAWSEPFFEW